MATNIEYEVEERVSQYLIRSRLAKPCGSRAFINRKRIRIVSYSLLIVPRRRLAQRLIEPIMPCFDPGARRERRGCWRRSIFTSRRKPGHPGVDLRLELSSAMAQGASAAEFDAITAVGVFVYS